MTEAGNTTTTVYSRRNPFLAKVTANELLTKPGSEKETRHLVIDLSGSNLQYTPGDSLAVFPSNPPPLVAELIQQTGFDPEAEVVNSRGQTTTLHRALSRDYIINRALKRFPRSLVDRIPQGEQRNRLMELLEDEKALDEFIFSRDYVDILKVFDQATFQTPQGFVQLLAPMVPRLYSIASSPKLYPTEVHLIVAIIRYQTHNRPKTGMASGFLADIAKLGVPDLPVFLVPSKTFRLPEDNNTDIIMCGPGTGIAPFRAFLQERSVLGGGGRHWLFFGEQHRATDFFYEDEFNRFQQSGVLHRFDTAFSRDQTQKIYVQHRLREHGREIWEWLQGGAYFYVCGDAKRMAKDVHQALIDIAEEAGGLSKEEAAAYVNQTLMRDEKRYRRDIY